MTLQTFFDKCKNHDWLYGYSDDHRVWTEGNRRSSELLELSKESPEHTAIWKAWCNYMHRLTDIEPQRPV